MKLLLKQENGVTLLEVLLAMAILSIVLISFMSMFPQMGMMNKHNEDKTQAINTAKDILFEWQNSEVVENFLTTPTSTPPPGYDRKDLDWYYFKTVKGNFDIEIKIRIKTDLVSLPRKTHQVHIQLFKDSHQLVTETYGYIILQ
jgi:prepilin-type N-terminal cleavage/methylation domain-containing protein